MPSPEKRGEKNIPNLERRTFYIEEHIPQKVELCMLNGQEKALTLKPIGIREFFEDGEVKIIGTYVQIVPNSQEQSL